MSKEIANNKIQANSLANNKIQAKKPEVGDVWEINGRKIRLEQVGEKYNKEYVYHISETSEGLKGYSIYTVSFIEAAGKYLGKSKVSIKELFDTVNDTVNDNVKEENEKDNLATDLKQIVRDSAKQVREIIDNWSKGVV